MILGGTEVGADTLSLFFAIHVIVMPILLFLLMPYHFWLVRKAGGVVVPPSSLEDDEEHEIYVPAVPNLTTKELSEGLVLIAFIMVYAIFFDAPLDIKANPGLSPNPTKAPWFLTGIQEMLMHFHPLIAAWIIPFLVACFLIILPYLKYDSNVPEGIWFLSHKGRRVGIIAAVTALVIIPAIVIINSMLLYSVVLLPMFPGVISAGLIPLVIIIGIITCFYIFIRKKYETNKNEAIQAVFILLLVAYVILSVICFWFRGEGMELVF
jgi:quinol-cytochrome oxidoreductase complex cytochrome b subunit